MKRFNIILTILITCLFGSITNADIWEWTDEDGVKHYSNYDPPAHAKIMMKTHELPFDEEAQKERLETERLERIELAKQELAEKEALLASRQLETEQRIAEADKRAAEALERAEDLLEQAAKADYGQSDRAPYVYVPYYQPSYYYSGYYSHGVGIYYHRKPFNRSHHRNRHFALDNKHFFKGGQHIDHHFGFQNKNRSFRPSMRFNFRKGPVRSWP